MGVIILLIIIVLIILFVFKFNKKDISFNNPNVRLYEKKSLMTKNEQYFYNILKEIKEQYNLELMPQLNLATIIRKNYNNKYISELFRIVDFAIFTKDYNEVLLLIEINDSTHLSYKRKKRDQRVKDILNVAGIRLITFYTNYPNQRDYVKNRVIKELFNFEKNVD